MDRGVERGEELAHRPLAERALGQFRSRQGPAESELAPTDLTVAVTELIFVQGHSGLSISQAISDFNREEMVWIVLPQCGRGHPLGGSAVQPKAAPHQ